VRHLEELGRWAMRDGSGISSPATPIDAFFG
jgi:hypothetical protein